jgi:hypothetical protein
MPYQLINSVTGQVQRASRLQLTAIHREAAKKKSPACALPQDLEMPEKRLQPPVSVAAWYHKLRLFLLLVAIALHVDRPTR